MRRRKYWCRTNTRIPSGGTASEGPNEIHGASGGWMSASKDTLPSPRSPFTSTWILHGPGGRERETRGIPQWGQEPGCVATNSRCMGQVWRALGSSSVAENRRPRPRRWAGFTKRCAGSASGSIRTSTSTSRRGCPVSESATRIESFPRSRRSGVGSLKTLIRYGAERPETRRRPASACDWGEVKSAEPRPPRAMRTRSARGVTRGCLASASAG